MLDEAMLFVRAIISCVTCFITFNFTVVLNIGKIVCFAEEDSENQKCNLQNVIQRITGLTRVSVLTTIPRCILTHRCGETGIEAALPVRDSEFASVFCPQTR